MPTPCEALHQTQLLDSIGAVPNLDGTSALLGPRTLIYSCDSACQRPFRRPIILLVLGCVLKPSKSMLE